MSASCSFLNACQWGIYNEVRDFIDSGVDINTCDGWGQNGLHYSLQSLDNGHENTIPLLIKAGIDINAQDDDGWNGLHIAILEDHENIIPSLIQAGIDINAQDADGCNGLHLAVKHNNNGKTFPLLIEAGIDINAQDFDGESALSMASRFGYESIECLLVDAGCALSEEDLQRNVVQNTLAANAVRRESAKN